MSRLHPFARLCIAAVGLFAAQLVAGLGLAAVYIGVQLAQTPGQSVGQAISHAARVSELNVLLLTLLVYPIGILWLGFCRAKFDQRSFISLGLRRPRFGSNLGRGVAAGFLSIAVIWAILWLTGAIAVNGFSEAARGPSVVLALLGWAIAFAAVGFFEEFVFRGYALHNLTNWLGWRAAVIVQAVLFAAVHLGNVIGASDAARLSALGAMPSIFLIAIFFALSYRKTGSLWFAIGFHAAWNFSLGCLFSLPVSGLKTFQLLDVQSQTQSWLSGGSFGAEGSFYLLPVLAALIWFLWQAPDHPQALLDLELKQPQPTSAPLLIAAADAATPPASESEIEMEPERQNRYRTKFGTSEGFDSEMLRELRELQHEREAAEVHAQQERTASQTVGEIEQLKPLTMEPEAEQPAIVEVIEVAKTSQSAAQEPKIQELTAETIIETPVEVTPKPQSVAVATDNDQAIAPASTAPEPAKTPAPAPKKPRPKW